MTDKNLDALKGFVDATAKLGDAMVKALTPVMESIRDVCKVLHTTCWNNYRNAGMPYGETEEGMLRWMREIAEIHNMRFQADRLESNHKLYARLRAKRDKIKLSDEK